MSIAPENAAENALKTIKADAPKRHIVRGIVRRLLAMLFGVVLTLLILEVFLRAGFELLPPSLQADIQHVQRVPWSTETIIPTIPFIIDHDFQLRLDPGIKDFPVHWSDARFTFSTIPIWDGHRAGLRTEPPRWPLDILTIGDSFTFCWTKYEDCWVHHLQDDYGWHIVNGGIPGTGTTGQLRFLSEVAEPVKPAMVIWQWYNNDISDDYDLARIRNEVGELQGAPAADPVPDPVGLARFSAVYALLQNHLNPPPKKSPYQHYENLYLNGRVMSVHTNEYTYATNLKWPQAKYGFDHNLASHLDGARLLNGLNAKLLLIIIPTKEEAYGKLLAQHIGQTYLDEMAASRLMILDQCKQYGWNCLDPLPAFQEAIGKGQTVYYAFDSHLDASGNKILAELVQDYITKNGLLIKR